MKWTYRKLQEQGCFSPDDVITSVTWGCLEPGFGSIDSVDIPDVCAVAVGCLSWVMMWLLSSWFRIGPINWTFHFHQRCLVYCGIYWCRMSYMTVKVGSLVFWHIQICIQRADSMFLFSCSHIFGFVTFASVHTWLIQCQPAQVKVCSEDWQALGNNCLFEGKILPWILMSSLQSLSNASIVSRVASTGTILWPWPRW